MLLWNFGKLPRSAFVFVALFYFVFVSFLLFISSKNYAGHDYYTAEFSVFNNVFIDRRRSAQGGSCLLWSSEHMKRGSSSLGCDGIGFDTRMVLLLAVDDTIRWPVVNEWQHYYYNDELVHDIVYSEATENESGGFALLNDSSAATLADVLSPSARLSASGRSGAFGEKMLPEWSRFIYTAPMCGGLGNQLFRAASLYGLGARVHRTPFFHADEECARQLEAEIADILPNLFQRMYFFRPSPADTYKVRLPNCCRFERHLLLRLRRLDGYKAVQLTDATALQSFRYFHPFRHEIRRLFRCADYVADALSDYATALFGGDLERVVINSRQLIQNNRDFGLRKVCVHTRTGDFVPLKIASDFNYTVAAIDRLVEREMTNHLRSGVAVVMLGEDKQFLERIRDHQLYRRMGQPVDYYVPRQMSRIDDLCFAVAQCDTLLITAHASTFSFWIGYLMRDDTTVYYNPDFSHHSPYSSDNFPPEWVPLAADDDSLAELTAQRTNPFRKIGSKLVALFG